MGPLIYGVVMETCEIVTIITKNGPVDINKSDFDEKKHKLYVEENKKSSSARAK